MIYGWTQTEIGDAFGLKEHTIREIRQKYDTEQIHIMEEVVEKLRLGRDIKIWKLLMLGRTQEEAGDTFGVSRESAKVIGKKLQTQIITIQHSFYKDKKTIEQIKEFNHLDEITAWAVLLKVKKTKLNFTLSNIVSNRTF